MVIHNIQEAAKAHGYDDPEKLHRAIYKYTDCGAWISWDEKSVTIGSIVEGSDAEFSRTFLFPFTKDEVDDWVAELEQLCDEAWHEANEEDIEYISGLEAENKPNYLRGDE